MKYAFVRQHQAEHTVSILCRVLRISRSGYYEWLNRRPGPRVQADQRLLQHIQQVHAQHRGHSGALKTWRVLRAQGIEGGRHRVARLRREHGIVAKRRRRFVVATRSKAGAPAAPNRLQCHFAASRPDRIWVGEGWLYLAVLLDLYSRRVVGWSMSSRNDTALALDALDMAVAHRRPGTRSHPSF